MKVILACFIALVIAGCGSPPKPSPVSEPPGPVITQNPDGTITARINAKAEWVTVGEVAEGEVLEFKATGEWGESPAVKRTADGGMAGMFGSGYWGVKAVNPQAPWGALVGRVGNQSFVVGQANIVKVAQLGILQLSINDGLGSRQDNHGFLTVTIKRRK